jgi:hypothetical protein
MPLAKGKNYLYIWLRILSNVPKIFGYPGKDLESMETSKPFLLLFIIISYKKSEIWVIKFRRTL